MLAKSKNMFLNLATKPGLCVVSVYSRGKNSSGICLIRHKEKAEHDKSCIVLPLCLRRNVMNHAPTLAHDDSLTFINILFSVFEKGRA